MQYPFMHPGLLEPGVNQILKHNDAFFTDTSVGNRGWDLLAKKAKASILDHDRHNSHQVIIRKRDRPEHRVQVNFGESLH